MREREREREREIKGIKMEKKRNSDTQGERERVLNVLTDTEIKI